MPDPFLIWSASAGTSKQKSVRMMWPELAVALDGSAGTPVTEMPKCVVCGKRPGRILVELPSGEHVGVCGLDVGLSRFHGFPKRARP